MITVIQRKRGFFSALAISSLALCYIAFNTYVRYVPVVEQPLESFDSEDHGHVDDARRPRILLVSAFYPLPKSKHSLDDYSDWLARFLEPITTPIYFFTSREMAPIVRKLRGRLPITINTTYPNPFAIPPLAGLESQYERLHEIDREGFRHSPELYAIWNAKPYFLKEGIRNSGSHDSFDYAFWTDAGSFRRSHVYTQWPDPARVENVWEEGARMSGMAKSDIIFFPIAEAPPSQARTWVEGQGPIDVSSDFSEGSFFGGTFRAIAWYTALFYAYHDHYLARGIFVGKDQTLINSLFVLYPERFITVWLTAPLPSTSSDRPLPHPKPLLYFTPRRSCGSQWYYYQFWLARPDERVRMRDMWDAEAAMLSGWSTILVDWVRGSHAHCTLTPVLDMRTLLKWDFGEGWVPPQRTVALDESLD